MKKLLLLSAALVALSSGLFADTIFVGSNGSLTAIPTTTSFTTTQLPYTGSPVNQTNTQVPFWNNPSQDSTGLKDGNVANVGDVLAGLATGTNQIGGNLAGTPSPTTPNTTTVISGSYFAGPTGNGDPVSTATPTAVPGLGAEVVVPSLEFSFTSQGTSLQVATLFADSGLDCPSGGSVPCGTGQYTSYGTYILANGACGSNCQFTPTAIGTVVNNISGTTGASTTDPNDGNTTVYGYYATVCYSFSGSTCNTSITYTTGAGNFTNTTNNPGLLAALDWNHFAYFELASGQMVFGFEDGLSVGNEGIGDFNDLIFTVTGNPAFGSTAPEPGTIAIMGLGLAGLGLIGRRRFAKK